MYETVTTVVGTLISRVDKRRLADGTTVVSFRVASNERRYDRATAAWRDGDSLYVGVTCWRRLAENVHASFVVGDPIVVHGRLFSRSYEKDGRRRTVTELEADAVGPDLARSTAVVTRNKRAEVSGASLVPIVLSVPSSDTASGAAGGAGVDDDPWLSELAEPDGPDDVRDDVHHVDRPDGLAGRPVVVEAGVGA